MGEKWLWFELGRAALETEQVQPVPMSPLERWLGLAFATLMLLGCILSIWIEERKKVRGRRRRTRPHRGK